jgi:NDP-sugar pyrophosphorylase family protein
MIDPYLVILAGGVSSRMRKPGTAGLDPRLAKDADVKSKGMIGVGDAGRPFLDYLLANADAAGYREVVIVVGEGENAIRAHYGETEGGSRFLGLRISYAVQPPGRTRPLGTADALLRGLESRPDWSRARVTVCNSDNLYSVEAFRTLLESPERCSMIDYDRSALAFPPERVEQYSVVSTDGEGYLRAIIEKPGAEEILRLAGPDGRVGVSMNIFRFATEIILPLLRDLPLHPVRQEKEIPVAVAMLVEKFPRAMRAFPRAEHVPDLTEKNDIANVQEYLRTTFDKKQSPPFGNTK